jgi:hypothetical protein
LDLRGRKWREAGEDCIMRSFVTCTLHHILLSCKVLSQGGMSRDSSVSIALGYRLDDGGSRVRFPAGAGDFSLHHRFQNGSGAHPASYPMGTRGSFPGGKAVGA